MIFIPIPKISPRKLKKNIRNELLWRKNFGVVFDPKAVPKPTGRGLGPSQTRELRQRLREKTN
ncbi:MAG: hypothetical protein WCW13_02855 [archaeon]